MSDPFASVAETYDIMIDWPARLARERPFFEALLRERPVQRVLDVGCGTGHHSRMFAEMGAQVLGLDPSEAMIARAWALSQGDNPQFLTNGFTAIPSLPDNYDLIVVLGNTLAYARDAADLTNILTAMRRALVNGGRACIQVVNYDNILNEESHTLPLIHRQVDGREYLFLREYRRKGHRVEFSITTLVYNGQWTVSTERSLHYAITGKSLLRAFQRAGYHRYTLYGSFEREPYDAETSTSLVALAEIS